MESKFKIIKAAEKDISTILFFIKKIAEYEKLEDQVTATEEILKESLFGLEKGAEVIIGFENNIPVGYAVYFYNFSTFIGRRGLYLEDLFVLPEHRGKGYGKSLFEYLINLAKEKDCGRFEWCVLNWNTPAIEFYKTFGAEKLDEWLIFRLNKENLDKL